MCGISTIINKCDHLRSMRNVLVIAYYFPPLGWSGVQRTLKFVKYLIYFGYNPIVVTVKNSNFNIKDYSLLDEINKDIKIIRIDDTKLKTITDHMKEKLLTYNNMVLDLINEELKAQLNIEIEKRLEEIRNMILIPDGNIIWVNNLIKEIQNHIDLKQIDIVYTTSGPYSDHLVGLYIKKMFNIPWVADFRDQWMSNPYYKYNKHSLIYKIEKEMEKDIVCNCSRIITTTSISRENFINKYNIKKHKIITITNGYDEEDFKNIEEYKKQNKFTICYNGSFYLSRNPYTFMQCIKECIIEKKIDKNKIQIILNGTSESDILNHIVEILGEFKDILIDNGYLNHKESINIAADSDILFVVCGESEECREVYTGKIFEYLRLKRPILAISPCGSLAEKLLYETNCGVNCEYYNKKKIKKYILHYYKLWKESNNKNTKGTNIEKYERKNLTKRLAEVFNSVVS